MDDFRVKRGVYWLSVGESSSGGVHIGVGAPDGSHHIGLSQAERRKLISWLEKAGDSE